MPVPANAPLRLLPVAFLVLPAGFSYGTSDTGGGDIGVFRKLEAMSHPLLSQQAGLDTGTIPKGQRSFT